MTQQFLPNGNLTPGIHAYNFQDFEAQFVDGFSTSTSRPVIYQNFRNWLEQLLGVLPPRYIWLDGSYLTQKLDPKDIDLVVFYYPEDIQNQQQADDVKNLINTVSRTHDCDAYLCYSLEHLTPQQQAALPNQHTIMQTYWMGQFGFDRSKEPKGMVQLDQQELLLSKSGGVNP